MKFCVVQPWGPDKAKQATVVEEHPTAEAAFAAIDRMAFRAVSHGAPSDYVELVVVNGEGKIVQRPES